LVALGIIFLVIGAVMPYYKSPQRLEGSGPNVLFTPSLPYVIRSYIVPPIDSGQPINISVLSDRPGSTVVLFAPFDPETQTIVGPPLVNIPFAKDQKGLVIFTNSTRSAPYMLMITSYNSSFTFYVSSAWSPFYQFRSFTTFGVAIVPFGLVMIYYDRIVEKRERAIEQALKGIGIERKN
jgi:hypothetical protein